MLVGQFPERSRRLRGKREATAAANKASQEAARQHRMTDGYEEAKRILRSRGFRVFDHSLSEPGSDLAVIGDKVYPREEVIRRAAKYREAKDGTDS